MNFFINKINSLGTCTRNLCRLKIVLTKVQPLWLRKDNYLFLILCFKIMENPGFLSEFQNSPDIQILLDMIHGKTSLTSDDLLEMLTMVDPVNTQDRIQVPDTLSLSPRRWLGLLVSASTCFHFCFFMTCFCFLCFLFKSIVRNLWSVSLLFTSETRLTVGFQQCFTSCFAYFPKGTMYITFIFWNFIFTFSCCEIFFKSIS